MYTGTCQPPLIFSDQDTAEYGQAYDGDQSSDDNQAANDPSKGIDI